MQTTGRVRSVRCLNGFCEAYGIEAAELYKTTAANSDLDITEVDDLPGVSETIEALDDVPREAICWFLEEMVGTHQTLVSFVEGDKRDWFIRFDTHHDATLVVGLDFEPDARGVQAAKLDLSDT